MSDLFQIDATGPAGAYRALHRETLSDVSGRPIAELSIVPTVFVDHAIAALRRSEPLCIRERAEALRRAGQLFAHGDVDGIPARQYREAVSRFAGVPAAVVRESAGVIEHAAAAAFDVLDAAMPGRAVSDWHDPRAASGVSAWSRRGEVLGVVGAGNHPGAHVFWLEAVAMGYRVAVRPSSREPFTPHRIVSALHASGFRHDHVAFLPTEHRAVDRISAGADLTIAYGGDDVVRKYSDDPSVVVFGPGRAKILVTREVDWRDHLEVLVESVTRHAGLTCVNATAVLVEGDPTPVARALADTLATLQPYPPEHHDAALPVETIQAAERLRVFVQAKAVGAQQISVGDVVTPLEDGSAVLGPAVFQLDSALAAHSAPELPFPCVWVAPWSPQDGLGPLRDSLVVTALTTQDELIARLLGEPTIANVYVGKHPTTWFATGIPHDGFLSDFLMRNKGFIRTALTSATATGS